ncbi:CobW/HypB/UreG, nucleotide-binding domain-containing protein [Haematococcus lacustris]
MTDVLNLSSRYEDYLLSRASSRSRIVPAIVLTGFLGAGKTTVCRHILRNRGPLRLTVLSNEVGALDVDSQLLDLAQLNAEQGLPAAQLAGGCVCCTAQAGFAAALAAIQSALAGPLGCSLDYLVVETSGVGDAEPLAALLLAHGFRLEAVVAVVDAEAGLAALQQQAVARAQVLPPHCIPSGQGDGHMPLDGHQGGACWGGCCQVSSADLVLLNKCDLAGLGAAADTEDLVQQVSPGVRMLRCRFGAVPLDLLLDLDLIPGPPAAPGVAGSQPPAIHAASEPHAPALAATTVTLAHSLNGQGLATTLLTPLGTSSGIHPTTPAALAPASASAAPAPTESGLTAAPAVEQPTGTSPPASTPLPGVQGHVAFLSHEPSICLVQPWAPHSAAQGGLTPRTSKLLGAMGPAASDPSPSPSPTLATSGHEQLHAGYCTCSVTRQHPVSLRSFQSWVRQLVLSPGVLRVKGSCWFAERRQHRYMFHLSGRQRVECLQAGRWEGPACLQLQLIGTDPQALQRLSHQLVPSGTDPAGQQQTQHPCSPCRKKGSTSPSRPCSSPALPATQQLSVGNAATPQATETASKSQACGHHPAAPPMPQGTEGVKSTITDASPCSSLVHLVQQVLAGEVHVQLDDAQCDGSVISISVTNDPLHGVQGSAVCAAVMRLANARVADTGIMVLGVPAASMLNASTALQQAREARMDRLEICVVEGEEGGAAELAKLVVLTVSRAFPASGCRCAY